MTLNTNIAPAPHVFSMVYPHSKLSRQAHFQKLGFKVKYERGVTDVYKREILSEGTLSLHQKTCDETGLTDVQIHQGAHSSKGKQS